MSGSFLRLIHWPRDWRWYVYIPLLLLSVGWFMVGYFTRPLQQVIITGEMLSASQAQPGTELAFEGDDLASGTFVTVADKLTSISSQGSLAVVHLNSELQTCDNLKSSSLKEINYLQFTCADAAKADFVRVTDIPLDFQFDQPTNVRVKVRSARRISIQPIGGQPEFPASLQVNASMYQEDSTETGQEPCDGDLDGNPLRPVVTLTVQNQPGVQITFDAGGRLKTLEPWTSAAKIPRPLCFLFESPGAGKRAIFETLYRQRLLLSASYSVGQAELRRTNGQVNVAGDRTTLLRTDAIDVRAEEPGNLSLSDERIDFEIPKAYLVRKGAAENQEGATRVDEASKGEDLRRRRLAIWPPWFQAMVGLLVSALGLQVILPFIIPKRLKQ